MILDKEKHRKIINQMLEVTTGSNKPKSVKAMNEFILSLEAAEIKEVDDGNDSKRADRD